MSDAGSWAIEVIVVDDQLYRRLAPETIRDGNVNRGAYYPRGEPDPYVSVDLVRLTTPERTRLGARRPDRIGVGMLSARVPINLGLAVRHAPAEDNDAHCLIEGIVARAICQTLADHPTIIIAPV